MSNRLEDYIKEHRKALDVLEPSAGLWAKIEEGLNQKPPVKQLKLYRWMGAAASVIIVFGLALLYFGKIKSQNVNIADVNPGLAKKEVRFASLIEEKRDSLAIFQNQNPDLYKKFDTDLKKIDADYQKLQKELPASPNQEYVVRAMVKNRELQLQLLKQQLLIINQVNQYKKENQI